MSPRCSLPNGRDCGGESLFTGYATLGGFGLSILFGIPIAMVIAYSQTRRKLRLSAAGVLAKHARRSRSRRLFVVWFGFGIFPKVISAFLLGFFPGRGGDRHGLQVDRDRDDRSRPLDARFAPGRCSSNSACRRRCPSIFSGLKVSATLAVVGAVVGEFVGSNSGIGYVLQIANGNFDLPLMFAALFVLSMMGVILFAIVDLAEKLMIPWHQSRRADVMTVATA